VCSEVRDLDGPRSQHEVKRLSGVGDLGCGERCDARAGLAVEQDQTARDPVDGGEFRVVQEAAAQAPSLVGFRKCLLASCAAAASGPWPLIVDTLIIGS
jgi:hypothetical protein